MDNLEEKIDQNTEIEPIEITEEIEVDYNTLSKDEKRALARTGFLPVIKKNVYTRFEDEVPQFGKWKS